MEASPIRRLKRAHLEQLEEAQTEVERLRLKSQYHLRKAYWYDQLADEAAEPPPPVYRGKPTRGKQLAMLPPRLAAMAAAAAAASESDEDDEEEGDSKQQKHEQKMAQHVRHLVDLFHAPTARVECTRAELEAADKRMQPNLLAIAGTKLQRLQKLADSVLCFMGDAVHMYLPVDDMRRGAKGALKIDKVCRACTATLTGLYVQTLRCHRSRFCVSCAMVLILRVGQESFHECLACMDHHDKKTHKLGTKAWNCRHQPLSTDPIAAREREDALQMFMAQASR